MDSNETRDKLAGYFDSYGTRAGDMLDAYESGAQLDESDGDADPATALDEYPLSVEIIRSVEITLTVGGPDVRLVAQLDADGDVTRVEFRAAWGGESFTRRAWEGDPLYRLAQHYAGGFVE